MLALMSQLKSQWLKWWLDMYGMKIWSFIKYLIIDRSDIHIITKYEIWWNTKKGL